MFNLVSPCAHQRLGFNSLGASPESLSNLQNLIGRALPAAFKDFYLTHDGGVPSNPYYWEAQGERLFRVHTFESVGGEAGGQLSRSYRIHVLRDSEIPVGYIPFARDEGGNLFCLNTADQVEFVEMDLDVPAFRFCAGSFGEFLSRLACERCAADAFPDDFDGYDDEADALEEN